MLLQRSRGWFARLIGRTPSGRTASRRAKPRARSRTLELESLESRITPATLSPIPQRGIDYSPTWFGETQGTPTDQTYDSDFYTNAYNELWGPGGDNMGRNDLKTIADAGFNYVRLYNWDQQRGWDGTQGTAHYTHDDPNNAGNQSINFSFLDYLASLPVAGEPGQHLAVMVPVNNYNLGNDQYSWNGQLPVDPTTGQVSYAMSAAPDAIQKAVRDFVSSITENGQISPAVRYISIGNEIDYYGDGVVGSPSVRLMRTIWWVVNMQALMAPLEKSGPVFFTSPFSDGDSGGTVYKSWFQATIDGVKVGDPVPNGTNSASKTFDNPNPSGVPPLTGVPGLSTAAPSYKDWWVNSQNPYQNQQGVLNHLNGYDLAANDPARGTTWPFEHFDVPYLITEFGETRNNASGAPGDAIDLTQNGQNAQIGQNDTSSPRYLNSVFIQAQTMEDYLAQHKGSTEFVGETYFEFTDEFPSKGGGESTYGLYMLAPTQPQVIPGPNAQYPGPPPRTAYQTGFTQLDNHSYASQTYYVDTLYAVTSTLSNNTLLATLTAIFNAHPIFQGTVSNNNLGGGGGFTGGTNFSDFDVVNPLVAVVANPGGPPEIKVYNRDTGEVRLDFFAFSISFAGDVRIALADVNRDGFPDVVVGAGPGGAPEVKVFNGLDAKLLYDFNAFSPSFTGGVYVAAADVNFDGAADIVVGAGPGGPPEVKVFGGGTLGGKVLLDFLAYDAAFHGGVTVAAADSNNDGYADIVTGTASGAAHVKVFSGKGGSLLESFFAYDPAFLGGVNVAAGDFNGDGQVDIITGTATGTAQVKIFNASTQAVEQNFFPFGPVAPGGVDVGLLEGTGINARIVVTTPGPVGTTHVKILDALSLAVLNDFFASNQG